MREVNVREAILALLEQSFDLRLHFLVIGVAFDVFTAGMDVAEDAIAINEEADAGEGGVAMVEPPAIESAPVGIDGNGEFEAELFCGALDVFDIERVIRFVVVNANYLQAGLCVVALELVEGGGGVCAIAAIGSGPPTDEDNFATEGGKVEGLGIGPMFEFPFGNGFVEFGAVGGFGRKTGQNRETGGEPCPNHGGTELPASGNCKALEHGMLEFWQKLPIPMVSGGVSTNSPAHWICL